MRDHNQRRWVSGVLGYSGGARGTGRMNKIRSVLLIALALVLCGQASSAGARTLVNASPEPFSNVAVSTAEDVATGGLLMLAIANPLAAALIAAILVVLSIWLVVAARRALKRLINKINPPRPMKNVTPPTPPA